MTSVNLEFRSATTQDAEAILNLVLTAYGARDSRPDWTGDVELAPILDVDVDQLKAKILDSNNAAILLAFEAGNDDALVASIQVAKRDNDTGRLSMLAVDSRYQRGGVGRQVLEHAEEHCRQSWGARRISLNALSPRKALIEWYLRRGYRKTGETSMFPRDLAPEIALPEDLHFVEMEKEAEGEKGAVM